MALSGLPGALGRESADVHFVEHLAQQRNASPLAIAPDVARGIDDLRGAMGPLGLEPRGRIGQHQGFTVETKAIARAGSGLRREAGKIPTVFRRQDERLGGDRLMGRDEVHFDFTTSRSPNAKVDATVALHFGADG